MKTKLKKIIITKPQILYWKILSFNTNKKLENMNYDPNNMALFIANLKQLLKITHEYHKNFKRILVFGDYQNPNKKYKEIYEKTNHIYISYDTWVNGIITNTRNACYHKDLETEHLIMLKTIKKPDLTITNTFFDDIATEMYRYRIPNITTSLSAKEKYWNLNNSTALHSLIYQTREDRIHLETFFCELIETIIKLPKFKNYKYQMHEKRVRLKKFNPKIILTKFEKIVLNLIFCRAEIRKRIFAYKNFYNMKMNKSYYYISKNKNFNNYKKQMYSDKNLQNLSYNYKYNKKRQPYYDYKRQHHNKHFYFLKRNRTYMNYNNNFIKR